MPISITGTGTITGISAGGLPDDCITTAEIAGSAVTTAKLSQPLTLETVQNATGSNTFFDFTGIPSWVKRITVMFDRVSTNGTSLPAIQLGDSGGVETSGYNAVSSLFNGSPSFYTTSFTLLTDALATVAISGHVTLNLLSSSANTWAISGILATPTTAAYMTFVGGTKSLSATLDRVRITTVNGTDTFDAGSINIMYEG